MSSIKNTPKTFTDTTVQHVTQPTPEYIINMPHKTFNTTTVQHVTQPTPEYNILDEVPYPTEPPPGDVAPDEEKPKKKKTSWNLKFILANLHRNINEYVPPMEVPEYKKKICDSYKKDPYSSKFDEVRSTFDKLKALEIRMSERSTFENGEPYTNDYSCVCESEEMPVPVHAIQSEKDFILNMMWVDYINKKNYKKNENCASKACKEVEKFVNKLNKKCDDHQDFLHNYRKAFRLY